MYELRSTKKFRIKYQKLTQKDKKLEKKLREVMLLLQENPYNKNLYTHKVFSSEFSLVYSSSLTTDLRILWTQVEEKLVLLMLDLGGHSGKRSVYK